MTNCLFSEIHYLIFIRYTLENIFKDKKSMKLCGLVKVLSVQQGARASDPFAIVMDDAYLPPPTAATSDARSW